jgi:hypothetical protein
MNYVRVLTPHPTSLQELEKNFFWTYLQEKFIHEGQSVLLKTNPRSHIVNPALH